MNNINININNIINKITVILFGIIKEKMDSYWQNQRGHSQMVLCRLQLMKFHANMDLPFVIISILVINLPSADLLSQSLSYYQHRRCSQNTYDLQGGFFNGPPLQVLSVRLHSRSHRSVKISLGSGTQSFLGRTSKKKHPV